jgi:hypothetical protein
VTTSTKGERPSAPTRRRLIREIGAQVGIIGPSHLTHSPNLARLDMPRNLIEYEVVVVET